MPGSIMKWGGGLLLVVFVVARIVPNFVKAKASSGGPNCVAQLRQIDGAIQQWAKENKKLDSDVPDLAAAAKYLKGGVLPKCPQGGTYQAGATVKDVPTCTNARTLGYSLSF